MPLPLGLGVAAGLGLCACTQTTVIKRQNRTAVNRRINLKTFQQGAFGPGEMVKMRVAEETPETKNCGVRANTASKTQPSDCWRLELLFFESSGPLRITVEPVKLASDDGYDTRPLAPMVAELAGSLLKGERMM